MIYLDYAATTPMDPRVIEAMTQAMQNDFGNASSLYSLGRSAHAKLEKVRQEIASSIHAEASDIIFTSGATEATNSALVQTARRLSGKGKHIITTQVEHASSYRTAHFLQSQGFEVTYLSLDEEGHISLDALKAAVRPDTIMVSILAGNNEVGSLQPIAQIGKFCQEKELFFYTDTVQTYGHIPIDVDQMGIDGLCVSAHKFYGPKGVGFLYYRKAKRDFTPYIRGGEQEHGLRAGTESLVQILGLGEAVRLLQAEADQNNQHLGEMRAYFLEQAEKRGLNFQVNGPQTVELPHLLNLYWPGHPSDQTLIRLDLEGICISAGSACSAGSLEPSRVLLSMYGPDSPRLRESLRLSFGKQTTREELDKTLDIFAQWV